MKKLVEFRGVCSRVEKTDGGIFRSTLRINEKSYPDSRFYQLLEVDAEIRPGTKIICVIYEEEGYESFYHPHNQQPLT